MTQILVIDDDPVFRDTIGLLLKSAGHQVDPASDGFAAILRVKERSYDVILIDYQLPDMDGYALARLLTDTAVATKKKPILVALTGYGDNLVLRQGADRLFHSILSKGVAPQQLLAHIAGLFESGGTRDGRDVAVRQFIENPSTRSARAAADEIWRANGLARRPRAAVSRTMSANEQDAITMCFEVVDEYEAELYLALDSSAGLDANEQMGQSGSRIPLIGLDPGDDTCDAVFVVGDKASWRDVARKVTEFSKRRVEQDRTSPPLPDRLPQRSAPPLVPELSVGTQKPANPIPLRARLAAAEVPPTGLKPVAFVPETHRSAAHHGGTQAVGSHAAGASPPEATKRIVTKERIVTKGSATTRVLVAETRNITRQVAGDCLRQAGFDVAVAADFEQALRYIDNENFDVLVVDEAMSSRCGQSAALELRCAVVDGEAVAIVGLAEKARVSSEADWRSRGYDAMLTHPFRPEELVARVRAQLARSNPAPTVNPGRSAIDQLVTNVGETEIQHLCRTFLDLLQSATFDQGSYNRAPAKCRVLANKLVATSDQLGFANLSRLCQELANHNGNPADLAKILSALSRECAAAVATVSKWDHVAA